MDCNLLVSTELFPLGLDIRQRDNGLLGFDGGMGVRYCRCWTENSPQRRMSAGQTQNVHFQDKIPSKRLELLIETMEILG